MFYSSVTDGLQTVRCNGCSKCVTDREDKVWNNFTIVTDALVVKFLQGVTMIVFPLFLG